jgi:hypothetical protein
MHLDLKDNWADLLLYYSVVGVPKVLNLLFRRR